MGSAFTAGETVTEATIGSSSTAAKALGKPAGASNQGGCQVRIASPAGTGTAFIKFGASDVGAATSADIPILTGSVELFSVGPNVTHVRCIAPAGTPTLYFTSGHGE
jgi:hypothetical protein